MPLARDAIPDRWWSKPADALLSALGTASREGLSTTEAAARLATFGRNALDEHRRANAAGLFVAQFKSPLVLILLFAAAVSALATDWTDAAVIAVIVAGTAVVTFFQEFAAGNAIEQLRSRLTHYVTAVRDAGAGNVPAEEIVPGDVILLSAGSLIPADAVVLESKDFFVNEAVLTGEPFPVEKHPDQAPEDATLAERLNCVSMGTNVRSGTARAVVVATGRETSYGQIAHRLSLRPPETEFERGIRHFGAMLTRIMIGLVFAVTAANIVFDKPPVDSLLFALALAVGISPELLPAIITITLSRGAREMARHGVIVRQLSSIENFGSMDVLCTDKTGTLTSGTVHLDEAVDPRGEASDRVARLAFLNASMQSGLANPLDEAIVVRPRTDLAGVVKADEIPWDFARKRLSIVVRENGTATLISKGALDPILRVCTRVAREGGEQPLDAAVHAAIQQQYESWSTSGIRVLGVASRTVQGERWKRDDESDLTFDGFLLFSDPPKPDAAAAVAELAKLGVELKIITGDNRHVTRHLADALQMEVRGTLTGAQIAELQDEALWHTAERTTLFVEVDPNQKERIIRALRKTRHVVGYLGDGINDAPALHEADVSISVDNATDVAREAAHFVLLERDLHVLRSGVEQGRKTFANTLKYVFTTTSANFGNMISMAIASLFLPFLPLLAKQVLLNNFLSDIPGIAIAGDNVDPDAVLRPRRWNVHAVRNFMIVFGLVSSVFDLLTFGLLLALRASPEEFRTAWFIESLLTELLVLLVVRTRGPFYASRPSRWLLLTTIAVTLFTLAVPYLPLDPILGFVPLSATLMALILLIAAAYVFATEATKRRFYRGIPALHPASA